MNHSATAFPRFRRRFAALLVTGLLPGLALTAGCLGEEPKPAPAGMTPNGTPISPEVPAVLEGSFVPIYRESETSPKPLVAGKDSAGKDNNFYLAISKKELGQPWFISSYLTQSDFGEFAQSLGTNVVSFKVQNDKLFVFLTEKGLEISDTLKPEWVLEAYPLVKGVKSFEGISNSSDYVLFDPAAGLNRFTLLGANPLPIDITVVFSQKFRKLGDGATFEQVWSGTYASTEGPQKVSGTISFGLRRYAEGEGFKPLPFPDTDWYFNSSPRFVKNEGTLTAFATKWNLVEGKPIVWAISGVAEQLRKEPRLMEFDFTGAIKAGIESWNQVFGWKALEARPAKEGEEYGQDDLNFFIFDSDKSSGPAFADMRHNPNTGEIRGASVYFPLGLINDDIPDAGTATMMPATPPGMGGRELELPPVAVTAAGDEKKPLPLAWGGRQVESTCNLGIRALDKIVTAAEAQAPASGMSRKQFVERYISVITAHEIGHTLGLRHNFKGSLKSPSSSVMDYLPLEDFVALGPTPGAYDVAAIGYLYGKQPTAPAETFCTDDSVPFDPECRVWDHGASPLSDHYIPRYDRISTVFLTGVLPPAYIVFVNEIVPHVRLAKDPAARALAYNTAAAPLRKPVGMGVRADVRDFLTKEVMERLFVRPLDARATRDPKLVSAPRPQDPVLTAAVTDLKAFLIDSEGTRGMAIRRNAADLLKQFQHASAAAALMEARAAINTKAATLSGNAAIETKDLVGRIDRYLGAYFD